MLISGFLSCALLLVQGAVCSDLRENPPSVNEKSSKQLITDTNLDTYEYNHPPVLANEQRVSREGKSVNIDELTTTEKTRSRNTRRRGKPRTTTPSLEIPVQVIYETAPTTVRSTSKSTTSPVNKTTRVSVRRRPIQSKNKKIDIRQTTSDNNATEKVTENVQDKDKNNVSSTELPKRYRGSHSRSNKKIDVRQTTAATRSSTIVNVTEDISSITEEDKSNGPTTEFPKRSRGSYFKKRTEGPTPKVKILEEKNFVYSHSGNFHYSFLDAEGTKISSEGSLKSYDNNKTGEAVSGSVFYTDKDGNDYSLSYTADENGYRPIGAHLPTPPPLPPAIARALKYIADKSTPTPPTKSNK